MRFFIDNNLAPNLADALHSLSNFEGCECQHLIKRFGSQNRDIGDREWMRALAQEKGVEWVIVSGDYGIYKNPQRREVWRTCRITTFFLRKGWTNQDPWTQAHWFVRWWPRFIHTARTVNKGAGFLVPAGTLDDTNLRLAAPLPVLPPRSRSLPGDLCAALLAKLLGSGNAAPSCRRVDRARPRAGSSRAARAPLAARRSRPPAQFRRRGSSCHGAASCVRGQA